MQKDPTGAPLLSLRGITKKYSGVVANDDVSLSVDAGEVVGLLGENGAGKSTLMHILSGTVSPDSGEIRLDGGRARFSSPRAAALAGIGMVHQQFMLVGALTVEENLALGTLGCGRFVVDYAGLREGVSALARELGMAIDFAARIQDLPVGKQQQIEILKTLSRGPRLLILDEPTAVLPPEERAGLFRLIKQLKSRGIAIILISHKLEDTEECCDRVVVMRQGRVVGESSMAGRTRAELVRLIVGGDLPPIERGPARTRESAIRVEGLTVHRPDRTKAVDAVSFELRAGEILGLCGVDGNGQSELVQALAGMIPQSRGRIVYRFGGRDHTGSLSAARLRRLGLAHIADDRLRHAVVANLSVTANWLLTNLHVPRFNRNGWLAPRSVAAMVEVAVEAYSIVTPGIGVPLIQLSGGNQQKVVLARELANSPTIVLAAHPARGLDVRTMTLVKQELLRVRQNGAAVLLVSADLMEVWEIADRVMVMVEGRLRGPVPVAQTTIQNVGDWMTSR